ncbi:hypothetical protein SEMRO_396_G134250.1 [Seminavis robusta]|uniref:Uncharacterized protein n=1 Tax=Seminavis robusta TaxID=568900 RepID=A0A9N8HGG4_9STRA|nr:hypothetical protein SEMRO_396_G134250.1 [Seminavis robusta]|eukprot:Sro396_g134250.1 n/a (102) ;mRNA; f:24014-24319
MTSFTAIDNFAKATLTSIPDDEKPTYNTLKIIHQELNANAMAVHLPSEEDIWHLAPVIPQQLQCTPQCHRMGRTSPPRTKSYPWRCPHQPQSTKNRTYAAN